MMEYLLQLFFLIHQTGISSSFSERPKTCSGLSDILNVFQNGWFSNGSLLTFEHNLLFRAFEQKNYKFYEDKEISSETKYIAQNICYTRYLGNLINHKIVAITDSLYLQALLVNTLKTCPGYQQRFQVKWIRSDSTVKTTTQTILTNLNNYKTIFLLTSLESSAMVLDVSSSLKLNTGSYTWVLPVTNAPNFDTSLIPKKVIGLQRAQYVLKQNATSINTIERNRDSYCLLNSTKQHETSLIFKLYFFNKRKQWKSVAFISSKQHLQIPYPEASSSLVLAMKTRIRVVTIIDAPFTMIFSKPEDGESCKVGTLCWSYTEVNDTEIAIPKCCIGYCMELLERIARDLSLDIDLYIVRDSVYGDEINKTWVGMVGDIVYERADLIVAPLTINAQRSQVIDYAGPFMIGGVAIATVIERSLIPFLNVEPYKPLSNLLWLLTFLTMIFASVCIFGAERLVERTKELSRYCLRMSLTYVSGLAFQRDQGGEEPKYLGSRVFAITVAIAMMVIMSSYTAVLTANQVSHTTKLPITGFKDEKIVNPTNAFTFGTIANSAFTRMFRESQDPNWYRMYRFMQDHNFRDTDKAIDDLKSGKLNAIIHDYPVLHYYISKETDCRIQFAGDPISDPGYGLAVKKGNQRQDHITELLLEYQNDGFLRELRERWLSSECADSSNSQSAAHQFGIDYFGGLFMLLIAGISFSIIFLFAECIFQKLRSKRENLTINKQNIKSKTVNNKIDSTLIIKNYFINDALAPD